MAQTTLTTEMIAAEVMTRWPKTIPIFIRHHMACVGCAIAPFETLAEVIEIHHLNLDRFMQELQQAIESSEADRAPVEPMRPPEANSIHAIKEAT